MKISDEKSRAIGTAIIIVVLTIVFGSILVWMYSVNLLILPEWLESFLGINSDSDGDDRLIDTSLAGVIRSDRPEDEQSMTYELTYENLRAALLTEGEPEGFALKMRVRYSPEEAKEPNESENESDFEESEPDENEFTDIFFFRSGKKYRIERLNARGELIELAIFNSYSVYHYESATGASRSQARSDDVSPENEAGLPSVSELLEIVRQFPEKTVNIDEISDDTAEETEQSDDFSEISPFSLTADDPIASPRYADGIVELVESELGNLYRVSYFDNLLGIYEEYFLSLKYNVITSHSIRLGDRLIYSCELLDFSTNVVDWSAASLYEP